MIMSGEEIKTVLWKIKQSIQNRWIFNLGWFIAVDGPCREITDWAGKEVMG